MIDFLMTCGPLVFIGALMSWLVAVSRRSVVERDGKTGEPARARRTGCDSEMRCLGYYR
jgi:hypothetical protein